MTDRSNHPINPPPSLKEKVAGVMIPLFSIRTGENFGIGEILDLIPFIDWMTRWRLKVVQILPIFETSPHETSPYQALSGFAIDPIYLSIQGWEDFKKSDLARHVYASSSIQEELRRCRASQTVCYELIRPIKEELLTLCFDRFKREEWEKRTARAKSFQAFMDEQAEWLDDYAVFRLLKEKNGWRDWADWPPSFRDGEPPALESLKREEEERLLYFKYLQWALWEQWEQARARARERKVLLMGDLPFLVSRDSADVWRHRNSFSAEETVGAPPDMFNEKGQEWGLPLFRWDAMEKKDFRWWRLRIRQARQFYDLIRLDHVVGFFRVWAIPKNGPPHFEPPETERQAERGKKLLNAMIEEARPCIPIAEDLGVIPDFVYQALEAFQIAGHKVLRWQKFDHAYHDPQEYPFVSLATTGTHDTSTLVNWWKELPFVEREAFLKMLLKGEEIPPDGPFSDELHQAILDRLMGSGSSLVILPIQDIFGFPDQINLPSTVGYHNWRYRLPILLEGLNERSPYKEKLHFLKRIIELRRHAESGAPHAPA